MAIHFNILAWRLLWTEEPGGLQPTGLQRVRHDGAINTFTFGQTFQQLWRYFINISSFSALISSSVKMGIIIITLSIHHIGLL